MDNPFKIFFSGINVLSGEENNSALGIDIGSSAIKVVELKKKKGKAVLETYGAIALGSYADLEIGRITSLPVEKIIEAVKEVLKQSGVVTKSSALAIPAQSSLIFTIELPSQISEGEIAPVVATEARKYIPIPITEISLDWFILPKKEISFKDANNPILPPFPPV